MTDYELISDVTRLSRDVIIKVSSLNLEFPFLPVYLDERNTSVCDTRNKCENFNPYLYIRMLR